MCGIAGIWTAPSPESGLSATVREMRDTLAHRGPDAAGAWVDPARGIGLGHRRLSIIDLSAEGAQPMHSACGRYVLVFNGEIYNYRDLRERMEQAGERFHGHSDTEVLLAACAAWGLETALKRCNGMFALALWDRQAATLTLARDRLGKKPLYYCQTNGCLLFASELKALGPAGGWRAGIDGEAAADFFRFGFIPGERSILAGVRKLLPGHLAVFSAPAQPPRLASYWRLEDVIEKAVADPFRGGLKEAEAQLDEKLRRAVRLRCHADVPVGGFLSGGLDSSLVVALMAAAGGTVAHTYTVGFSDDAYDESAAARAVASALGCAHRETRLEPADLPGLAESLPEVYDEPFADVSQVPTLLVSRFAREQVTVCLSGDGGDEVFGGYHRHFMVARQWPWLSRIPWPLRRGVATLLRGVGPDMMAALLGKLTGMRTPTEKLGKVLTAMEANNLEALYRGLLSQGGQADGRRMHASSLRMPNGLPEALGLARRVMAMDTLGYLPDDILVKTDRASMSVGLELRSPFLDADVLAFAWSLPESWLVHGDQGKRILRGVLARYLPESLFNRPKMGFAVPIDAWLRGPLRAWAEPLLMADFSDPWLAVDEVRARWAVHQSGRAEQGHWLWRALIWRAWREHWHV